MLMGVDLTGMLGTGFLGVNSNWRCPEYPKYPKPTRVQGHKVNSRRVGTCDIPYNLYLKHIRSTMFQRLRVQGGKGSDDDAPTAVPPRTAPHCQPKRSLNTIL